MLLQNNCTNEGAIRWGEKIQDSVLFYIVRGGGGEKTVARNHPQTPSPMYLCEEVDKKKGEKKKARTKKLCATNIRR